MADHKRKKKRGRSKLFTSCFPLLHDKSDRRSIKNGRLGKPVLMTVTGREEKDFVDVNPVNDSGSGFDCAVERSGHRRSVSRLLKAVLFDSVMVKKISSSSKSSIASDTNESFQSIERIGKQSNDSNACGREPESTDMEDSSTRSSILLSSSSRTTSSSNSSSSSSFMNSNSRRLSDQKTSSPVVLIDSNHPISSNSSTLQIPNLINSSSRSSQPDSIDPKPKRTNSIPQSSSHNKGLSQSQPDSIDSSNLISSNCDKIKSGCNNLNIRWCLFLMLSLIVLVAYGRIYSILCTSIWFYLVPCRRLKRVNSATNTARFMDTESEQYKKRVIMTGLLDRTRNPLRCV